jgi:hypothetical protein
MIYSANAEIVLFIKNLVQSLKPYAESNEIDLNFTTPLQNQVVYYQPFLLSVNLQYD